MRRLLSLLLLGLFLVSMGGCVFQRNWWKKTLRTVTNDIHVAFDDADAIVFRASERDHEGEN